MVERITPRRLPLVPIPDGGGISLRLGLKGFAAEGTTVPPVRLRWAGSTDAEGDGDVQQTSAAHSLHRRLDKTLTIDGLRWRAQGPKWCAFVCVAVQENGVQPSRAPHQMKG